jgi:hypothetical protein
VIRVERNPQTIAGVLVIAAAVAFVEYLDPDLPVRALAFVGFLAIAAVLARSTVVDALFQIRDHLALGRKPTRASRVGIAETIRLNPAHQAVKGLR